MQYPDPHELIKTLSDLGVKNPDGAIEERLLLEMAVDLLVIVRDFPHSEPNELNAGDLKKAEQLHNLIKRTRIALDNLSGGALLLITNSGLIRLTHYIDLVGRLQLWEDALKQLPTGTRFKRGRPGNADLHRAVECLADVYERCTGNKPKRVSYSRTKSGRKPVGPFYKFCAQVVSLIDPSLEKHLENAIDAVLRNNGKYRKEK